MVTVGERRQRTLESHRYHLAAAIRDIPLVAQLATQLRDQRQTARFADSGDHVFATGNGTPLGHRNVESRALQRAAAAAGLEARALPRSAPHLRQPPDHRPWARRRARQQHPRPCQRHDHNIYTHLFDDARHATEIGTRIASSPFARLLEPDHGDTHDVVAIARPASPPTSGASARPQRVPRLTAA